MSHPAQTAAAAAAQLADSIWFTSAHVICTAQIERKRLQTGNNTSRHQPTYAYCTVAELALNSRDVWGHFAPMFHLVDAFAIYAITLVGGRHAILPTFTPQEALLTIGEQVSCNKAVDGLVVSYLSCMHPTPTQRLWCCT